jgi:alpha-glucosidase
VCGFTDPDNRRTYPWGHEDKELIDFHKAAIKMHKENEVLRTGSYKQLYSAHNVIAYGRFTSDDCVIIISLLLLLLLASVVALSSCPHG